MGLGGEDKVTEKSKRIGMRFSHVYGKRSDLLADSKKLRVRLLTTAERLFNSQSLAAAITREIGIEVYYLRNFFLEENIEDVLDAITVIWRYLRENDQYNSGHAERWRAEVEKILTEERVHYRVDKNGGMRLAIDEEFEESRASTLAGLEGSQYNNVREEFEGAFADMTSIPTDGKGAMRGIFHALEGLFRLMYPGEPRLTAAAVDKRLMPTIQQLYSTDTTAQSAAAKYLQGFRDWIDATHFYRHEPGTEEVAQPPLPLAIHAVSAGASYLRWLLDIHKQAAQVP